MQVTYASVPAPGHANEDYIVTGPTWVAVFDGATPRPGVGSGCIHDVPWLITHLASSVSQSLVLDSTRQLSDILAQAIETTCQAHGGSCDLDNPDSPSATASILRITDARADYLVLADSPILARIDDRLQVIADERSARLPSYTPESVRAHRNSQGGFWVASTRTEAAYQAVTGALPLHTLNSAAVLTDGVTRYVERVALGTWEDLDKALRTDGPDTVIERIRHAEEMSFPELRIEPGTGRMVKRHDDATAAVITFPDTPTGGH